MQVSGEIIKRKTLEKNNFTPASKFVNGIMMEDNAARAQLKLLYLHNYTEANADSYAPLILRNLYPKSTYGSSMEKKKEELLAALGWDFLAQLLFIKRNSKKGEEKATATKSD